MYVALYSEHIGLGGFKCIEPNDKGICGAVAKTEKGIQEHCWRKHGKKVQREFRFPEPIRVYIRGDETSGGDSGGERNDRGAEHSEATSPTTSTLPEVRDSEGSEVSKREG